MAQLLSRAAAALLLVGVASPAWAELPPWVYSDEQRRAPLVAEIRIEQNQSQGLLQTLRARVLSIRRQSLQPPLRSGSMIEIAYERPAQRQLGWAGPSPIPELPPGSRSWAWLTPLASTATRASLRRFTPAAGGKSFGPSLETLQDPVRSGYQPPSGAIQQKLPRP
jgi:hypothetical protein